jgi:N-acetylglutamate synthase-like GNAT family acetyltransferase
MQMIGVAHPKYRQDLLENAKLNNLIYQDQTIPVSSDGIVVACPDIEFYFETKSKGKVLIAPAKPTDERGLQELYYSLSEKDRIMRFLTPQKEFSHEQTQSHLICDYDTCLVLVGIVGKKEEDQRIIAASAYYLDPNTNTAEFSITIHDDYRKQGLGSFLLEKIIEIAEQRGIQGLFGDVYVNNIGMLQILNNIPYDVVFTSHPDEEDTLHFHFYFKSKKIKE